MKERATLRDIAELAAVSLSTASQALNNRSGVAVETRARVLQAATALGYQHQVRIASPITSQINTIGLLMKQDPDKKTVMDPFYFRVLQGIEAECRRLNLSLLYSSVAVDENSRVSKWPSDLPGDNIADGWIVIGAMIEMADGLLNYVNGRPVIIVNGNVNDGKIDRIEIDNCGGVYEMIGYLVNQGHRRIGFIGGGPGAHPSIHTRRRVFISAMQEYGLDQYETEDSLVISPDAAEDATRTLLSRAPDITAIFGANDFVAIGVMKVAHSLGLSIPDDLSVVGFDDIDMAQHTIPPLTTIHVDKEYMGAMAVRQLYDHPALPNRPRLKVTIGTSLVIRDSVKQRSNRQP